MKTLNTDYFNSIKNKQVNTLAICWKIQLNDGTIFGFTSHNRDIVLTDEPTIIYKARTGMKMSDEHKQKISLKMKESWEKRKKEIYE